MDQYIEQFIVYLTNNTFVEYATMNHGCYLEIAELIAEDENSMIDFIL